jgi:TRAP-type uncharacterized transport system fused permease subunit
MLFINTTPLKVVQIVLSSCIGMFGLAAGIEGYMARRISLPLRLAAVAGGLLLIDPGLVTDLVGIGLIAAVTLEQVIVWRREKVTQRS